MENSSPPGVVETSDADLPHDAAAAAGTNTNDTPMVVAVQFESVAMAAANLSPDVSPPPGVITVDNQSAKRLRPSPSATSSTTS